MNDGGTLAQWRSATNADAQSLEATIALSAAGRILAGSAAINAGMTLIEVTDDIDGQLRTGTPDLGADELADGIYRNGFE